MEQRNELALMPFDSACAFFETGDMAALKVVGVDVVRFAGRFYRNIAQVSGLEGKVLKALDTGGFAALVELLTVYHLDEQGGYWRLDGEAIDSAV